MKCDLGFAAGICSSNRVPKLRVSYLLKIVAARIAEVELETTEVVLEHQQCPAPQETGIPRS
jgi:hypothetical protein